MSRTAGPALVAVLVLVLMSCSSDPGQPGAHRSATATAPSTTTSGAPSSTTTVAPTRDHELAASADLVRDGQGNAAASAPQLVLESPYGAALLVFPLLP